MARPLEDPADAPTGARLEPLDLERHRATLYESAQAPGAANRFRYLPNQAPADLGDFSAWLETVACSFRSANLRC